MRKLGADKIALLGLFVGALLTARLVVGLRSALLLSEPIPLPGTGLSISVPMRNGWQSEGKWGYFNGAPELGSSFFFGGTQPTASVICRYLATAETATARMWFEQEAAVAQGDIAKISEIPTDMLIFEWARVEARKSPLTMLLGRADLPDGGQLDIKVVESTGDAKQAEQVFKSVIESVNFQKQPARGRLGKMRP